jgi:transposase
VQQRLDEHGDRIEVFYLPSYSPELNPDELLNADLKQHVTKAAPPRTKAAPTRTAIGALRSNHPPQDRTYIHK